MISAEDGIDRQLHTGAGSCPIGHAGCPSGCPSLRNREPSGVHYGAMDATPMTVLRGHDSGSVPVADAGADPADPSCALRDRLYLPSTSTGWADWVHGELRPGSLVAEYQRWYQRWLTTAEAGQDERVPLNRMSGVLMELRLAATEGIGLLERLRSQVVPTLRELGAVWLAEGRATLARLVKVPCGRPLPIVPVDQAAFAAFNHACRILRAGGSYTQFAVTAELAVSQYILAAGEWNSFVRSTAMRPADAEIRVLGVLEGLANVVTALLTSTGRELDVFDQQLGERLEEYLVILADVEEAASVLADILGAQQVIAAVRRMTTIPASVHPLTSILPASHTPRRAIGCADGNGW